MMRTIIRGSLVYLLQLSLVVGLFARDVHSSREFWSRGVAKKFRLCMIKGWRELQGKSHEDPAGLLPTQKDVGNGLDGDAYLERPSVFNKQSARRVEARKPNEVDMSRKLKNGDHYQIIPDKPLLDLKLETKNVYQRVMDRFYLSAPQLRDGFEIVIVSEIRDGNVILKFTLVDNNQVGIVELTRNEALELLGNPLYEEIKRTASLVDPELPLEARGTLQAAVFRVNRGGREHFTQSFHNDQSTFTANRSSHGSTIIEDEPGSLVQANSGDVSVHTGSARQELSTQSYGFGSGTIHSGDVQAEDELRGVMIFLWNPDGALSL